MKTVFQRYLFASLLFLCGAVSGAVYPVKISNSNPSMLVDQNNVPFLIVGDSPQSLVVNLSPSDASSYMVDRGKHGFNTLLVDVVCTTYTFGPANANLLNGTLPFTNTIQGKSSYDLTTPNPAYFAYLDQIITMAATNGIEVMLDPIETGGWLTTMLDNGAVNCRTYGQYLGNRYKNFPNIIWSSGNDFQNWSTPANDAVVMAVALGIKDEDMNHLQTIELGYSESSSLDDPNWASIVGLNAAYTYFPTYDEVLHAYNQSTNKPVFLTEANYEFESLGGAPVTTAPILRQQEYWTLLSGGVAGQLYGNHYTVTFTSGWQANLDTPGAVELGYVTALFAPRAWYNLVPDTNHTVVTAGYGTYSSTGFTANSDYLTAASTPDGTLAIAYMPTVRTITVNLAKFSAAVIAQWYDPSSGDYLPITGSPFTNTGTQNFTPPGNNADGDGGWVLVLGTDPPPVPVLPALVQQNYATPQTTQAVVSVTYSNAQIQGDANILAIGWFDTNASISTVSDSMGNVYQAAVPTFRSNGLSHAIYYASGIRGGTNTVTVMFNQAADHVNFRATEYCGLSQANAFDAGSSASGIGTNANSGWVITTSTNDLIFGAGVTLSGFTAAGVGFVDRIITVPNTGIIEDMIAATSGTYSASAPIGSSHAWLMQVAAFKDDLPNNSAPSLRIFSMASNTAVVAWPGYVLQQNSNLTTTNWVKAPNAITVVSNAYQVIVSPLAGQEFYRLESGIGMPLLHIFSTATNAVVVSWSGYVLQQNTNLMTTNWVIATNMITVVSNEYQILISPLFGREFYRLIYP
jgi:hypothetical protein